MQKIGIVGSFSSILGLIAALISFESESGNPNVFGDQNTVIENNHGVVNIDQSKNMFQSNKGSRIYLKNSKGGAVLVVSSPRIPEGRDSDVCLAMQGTEVTLTGISSKMFGLDMWREVVISSGDCTGKKGWVTLENLVQE